MQNPMNPYGAHLYNGAIPSAQFNGPIPVQNLGAFANRSGYFNNTPMPFHQAGPAFPMNGGYAINPGFSPAGFPAQPMINPMLPNYPVGPMAGPGFDLPQPPYAPPSAVVFEDPNHFGSGSYGRPRSRASSRHRSKSRNRHHSASSSSDDERHGGRGSPYGHHVPYANAPVVPPRGGSPFAPGIPFNNAPVVPPRGGSPFAPGVLFAQTPVLPPRGGSPFAPGIPFAEMPVLPPRGGSPLLPAQSGW